MDFPSSRTYWTIYVTPITMTLGHTTSCPGHHKSHKNKTSCHRPQKCSLKKEGKGTYRTVTITTMIKRVRFQIGDLCTAKHSCPTSPTHKITRAMDSEDFDQEQGTKSGHRTRKSAQMFSPIRNHPRPCIMPLGGEFNSLSNDRIALFIINEATMEAQSFVDRMEMISLGVASDLPPIIPTRR
jgi:hypothetical protein